MAQVISFPAAPAEQPKVETTHEQYVHAIRAIVAPRVADPAERQRLLAAKLVYGSGPVGVRGLCYFGAWQNGSAQDFIEIAAISEEGHVQLAGTTIHELGHCLAGAEHGHGQAWKAACRALGLREVMAAGQGYTPEHFDTDVWAAIDALPRPSDGQPAFGQVSGPAQPRRRTKACPLGVGTRGGRSRGPGSGSRMRLYICGCPEGTKGRKVRSATDELDATCNRCDKRYEKAAERV